MSRPTHEVRTSAFVALTIGLSLSACGGASDDGMTEVVPGQALSVSSADRLAVGTVRVDGAQINRGRNAFLIDFDPTTTEVTSASTLMPAHGHGSLTPSLAREGDGYRISDVVFNMPGLWEVRLELAVDGQPDRLVFNADAP
jgi:hypothetical protein